MSRPVLDAMRQRLPQYLNDELFGDAEGTVQQILTRSAAATTEERLLNTRVSILPEEYEHVKRFLALIALSAGETWNRDARDIKEADSDDKSPTVNQRELYIKRGILPKTVMINFASAAAEQNIDILNYQHPDNDITLELIDSVAAQITEQNIANFYVRLMRDRPLVHITDKDSTTMKKSHTSTKIDNLNYRLCDSEAKISAMMMFAAPTKFFNKGNKTNEGILALAECEADGFTAALVGARFEVRGMESNDIKGGRFAEAMQAYERELAQQGNGKADFGVTYDGKDKGKKYSRNRGVSRQFVFGERKIYDKFYEPADLKTARALGVHANAADAALQISAAQQSGGTDRERMQYRLYISLKKYFLNAIKTVQNAQEFAGAAGPGRKAYIRISGLGDGVWAGEDPDAVRTALGCAARQVFDELSQVQKSKIAAIEFCQFKDKAGAIAGYKNSFLNAGLGEQDALNKGVAILGADVHLPEVLETDPKFAHKLEDRYAGCALFNYLPFDGMPVIGNEVHNGNNDKKALSNSMDPVAVCATNIGVTMNPDINVEMARGVEILSSRGDIVVATEITPTVQAFREHATNPDCVPPSVLDKVRQRGADFSAGAGGHASSSSAASAAVLVSSALSPVQTKRPQTIAEWERLCNEVERVARSAGGEGVSVGFDDWVCAIDKNRPDEPAYFYKTAAVPSLSFWIDGFLDIVSPKSFGPASALPNSSAAASSSQQPLSSAVTSTSRPALISSTSATASAAGIAVSPERRAVSFASSQARLNPDVANRSPFILASSRGVAPDVLSLVNNPENKFLEYPKYEQRADLMGQFRQELIGQPINGKWVGTGNIGGEARCKDGFRVTAPRDKSGVINADNNVSFQPLGGSPADAQLKEKFAELKSNIQTFYDPSSLSLEAILDVSLIKGDWYFSAEKGGKFDFNAEGKNLGYSENYKRGLSERAPFLLSRCEVMQSFEATPEGYKYIDQEDPRAKTPRPFYCNNYPNLSRNGVDLVTFAESKKLKDAENNQIHFLKKNNAAGELRETIASDLIPEQYEALKERFKSSITLSVEAAYYNRENVFITAPGAFLKGLRCPKFHEDHNTHNRCAGSDEQLRAKLIFLRAVVEVVEAREKAGTTQRNIFVQLGLDGEDKAILTGVLNSELWHNGFKLQYEELKGRIEKLQQPLILSNEIDAFKLGNPKNEERLGGQLATTLNVEFLGPVGNYALGDLADSAMEEGATRQFPSLPIIAGTRNNPNLYDQKFLEKNSYELRNGSAVAVLNEVRLREEQEEQLRQQEQMRAAEEQVLQQRQREEQLRQQEQIRIAEEQRLQQIQLDKQEQAAQIRMAVQKRQEVASHPAPIAQNPQGVSLREADLNYYLVPGKNLGSAFDGTSRSNSYRVLKGTNMCDDQGVYIERTVKNVLTMVILKVADDHKIDADLMKRMIEFAKANGGFSNKFHKETNSYLKITNPKTDSEKAPILTDDELSIAQEFSKDVQDLNAECGILTGRNKEDNLKDPLVGLRSAFALALAGDLVMGCKSGSQYDPAEIAKFVEEDKTKAKEARRNHATATSQQHTP